jgi:hypothetical protein
VFPQESVRQLNEFPPTEPRVLPHESVRDEKDSPPSVPRVLPQESVRDEKDCPPIEPRVLPHESWRRLYDWPLQLPRALPHESNFGWQFAALAECAPTNAIPVIAAPIRPAVITRRTFMLSPVSLLARVALPTLPIAVVSTRHRMRR